MKLEKVLILSNDNDFYHTWSNLLNTLGNAILEGFHVSKEQLLKTINKMSFAHYLMFQNKFKNEPSDYFSIEKCLELSINQILINDEVTAYLNKTNWDNGETHYVFIEHGKVIIGYI